MNAPKPPAPSPEDVPLKSPMPHSPVLDREEPELANEEDIPQDEPRKQTQDPSRRKPPEKPATR